MHESVMAFVESNLDAGAVAGKRVLEVGSQDLDGSPRRHLERLSPAAYIGVDMQPGAGVDRIVPVSQSTDVFGADVRVSRDEQAPGVFVSARKPASFVEVDLNGYDVPTCPPVPMPGLRRQLAETARLRWAKLRRQLSGLGWR